MFFYTFELKFWRVESVGKFAKWFVKKAIIKRMIIDATETSYFFLLEDEKGEWIFALSFHFHDTIPKYLIFLGIEWKTGFCLLIE